METKSRRIILIRHAQSEENIKVDALRGAWNRVTKEFRLPTWEQLKNILLLATCELNSNISALGNHCSEILVNYDNVQ